MIRIEKQRLRTEIRAILQKLPAALQSSASATIRIRLASWPVWQQAASICAFCALPGEPDLLSPWPWEKSISLPRVEGDCLSLRQVSAPHELTQGSFGIMEPSEDAPISSGGWDFILVPGLAFDRKGGRLGRGRGYYDRFLSLHANTPRIGVCFDEQLVPAVPREPHDLCVHSLITPSAIFHFETSGLQNCNSTLSSPQKDQKNPPPLVA